MRKITGKALATVLAMALITSSFSGTFAFAASKTEKAGKVSFGGDDEITLVKDTEDPNAYQFDLNGLIGNMTMDTVDKTEKGVVVEPEDISFRHAKGDSLISVNKEGYARVKSDKTGTETIMVYGEATITRDDKDVTLKGQKEITIHVVKSGTLFVGVEGVPETKKGKEIPELDFSFNDQAWHNVAVYKAVAGENLVANYVQTDVNNDDDKDPIRIEGSKTGRFEVKTDENDEDAIVAIRNNGKGTGTLKLTIKSKNSSGKYNTTEETTTATVLKRIDVRGNAVVSKDSSKTIISGDGVAAEEKDSNNPVWGNLSNTSISGYDLRVIDDAVINLDESVSVGNIKNDGDNATVSVNAEEKVKVGDVTDVNDLSIDNATVGAVDVKGNVTMSNGRVASIEADGKVTINGGTVTGNIVNEDKDEGVVIDAEDDEVNTVISGTVEAAKLTVQKSSEDAKVQIANVLLKDDGEITLSDSGIEINKLDCAYEGNVIFESFEGKLASIINANDVTVDEDSNVVVEGASEVENLDVAEDGAVEFRDAVTAASVSGDGKLVVPAGKLHVTDNVSGNVKLRLAGSNVNVGDVAFTADKDVADIDSFEGIGFKMEKKSVDKNTDSFLVKSVSFAGVALDKSEVTIAKGFSDTVTVSNYPASTSLPAGASVVWDYSDADKDVFEITADGATLNIKVKEYDDVYATSNSFDLYATVVDSDGDALEDYDSAVCTVTAIPEVVVSSDLSGIVEVPQGSTKDFVVNSQVEAPVTIGTGNVAVHALKTPFANGQATYTIKATGEVGTTAGVYATVPGQNAVKLFIIKVTAPVVTSDTTVDFDLTAGSRYVFKITAPSAPAFTVGNGAVLKTQAGKIVGNDYYFAVYAIGSAGQSTGVYVNGVKVCTVTVK